MAHDDELDRLIDALLREELGGERPPDVAPAVLRRARTEGRARTWRAWSWRLAPAAAVLAVLVTGFVVAPWLVGTGDPLAGKRIETTDAGETLQLDGYCKLVVEPQTALRIDGKQKARRVYLEYGSLHCDVAKDAGTFDIDTSLGVLSVKGTEFAVQVTGGKGDSDMSGRQLLVRVVTGAVVLATAWGGQVTFGGEGKDGVKEDKPPEGGTLAGILVKRDSTGVDVKPDGERESRRFGFRTVNGALDEEIKQLLEASPPRLIPSTRVKLVWIREGEESKVLGIEGEPRPAEDTGTVMGIVTACGSEGRGGWLEVKPANGPVERYLPNWRGQTSGGPDSDVMNQIRGLGVGDLVELKWSFDHRKRVENVKILKSAGGGDRVAVREPNQPDKPGAGQPGLPPPPDKAGRADPPRDVAQLSRDPSRDMREGEIKQLTDFVGILGKECHSYVQLRVEGNSYKVIQDGKTCDLAKAFIKQLGDATCKVKVTGRLFKQGAHGEGGRGSSSGYSSLYFYPETITPLEDKHEGDRKPGDRPPEHR